MTQKTSTASRRCMNWRRDLRSDNITLIPASQLPFRDHWAAIAAGLPSGQALLVVPERNTPLRQMARALVPQLRAHGRQVTARELTPSV